MSNRIRSAAVAATLLMMSLAILDRPTGAQEPTAPRAVDLLAKKRQDAARRVPSHFGQIGLTTEQRANIYAIQGKRLEKIEALEQQIAQEKAEMLAQSEATLTDTQKKLLDNLRRAASEPGVTRTDASKPSK